MQDPRLRPRLRVYTTTRNPRGSRPRDCALIHYRRVPNYRHSECESVILTVIYARPVLTCEFAQLRKLIWNECRSPTSSREINLAPRKLKVLLFEFAQALFASGHACASGSVSIPAKEQ